MMVVSCSCSCWKQTSRSHSRWAWSQASRSTSGQQHLAAVLVSVWWAFVGMSAACSVVWMAVGLQVLHHHHGWRLQLCQGDLQAMQRHLMGRY